MLKYKLDQTAFDSLSEAEKTFYKQDGELFVLQVEGATDKGKVDEFRQNNIEANNKISALELKYKGIDLDKHAEYMAQEAKFKDAKFIDAKDFDGLKASYVEGYKSDFEAKINNLTQQLSESNNNNSSIISKYEIKDATTLAMTAHKISPDAHDAIRAQINNKFSVVNGSVVSMNGDKIELGADGNLTVDEFVANQPEIFKLQSNGGGGQGNENNTPQRKESTSQQKIHSGLKRLMKA
jgi:hypothetical protein